MSDVNLCTSPGCSHRWSISHAQYETFEGTVKKCFLFKQLTYAYSVVIMFEDDNRTLRRGIMIIPMYNKTIVARCSWDPWVLYTRGGKWHPRLRLGAIFPLRCTKRHGPRHSVQQLHNRQVPKPLISKP